MDLQPEFFEEGLGKRPLVLIAHSMGGIIAKQILRTASESATARYRSIAEKVCGIAFIATPHSGSDIANFATLLKGLYRTNPQVIELVRDSSYLQNLHEWFLSYPRLNQLVCRTYSEDWDVQPANPLIRAIFPKTVRIVSPSSSEPNIPGERATPLDADHIGIVKPASRDAQLFKGMKDFLNECKARISKPGMQGWPSEMESLVNELLPPDLSQLFTYCSVHRAQTDSDSAGISLVAEVIDRKARSDIRVIGRGPQLVDSKTKSYITAVAKAILRGVSYTRILVIDPTLPQNALLWLLFFERFLGSSQWRDSVHLYKKKSLESNASQQFQIVDKTFLHDVVRYYSNADAGASRRADSTFALIPDAQVNQYLSIYENHLRDAGPRHRHKDLFELLTKILNSLDQENQTMPYYWQLALDVVAFLEALDVSGIPPSRIEFVGCLIPFTFTHDAAKNFAARVNKQSQADRVIALPFRRIEDAINQFLAKRLTYVCLPVTNNRLENLVPPAASEAVLASLKESSRIVDEIELPVSFVLAGRYNKPTNWRTLAAVEAAYAQVTSRLPKNAARLNLTDDEVESNYHAALLARQDASVAAITTPQAAEYLGLHVYKELCGKSDGNRTKFAIFSH
jgi:prephenate dehydratase-like protein